MKSTQRLDVVLVERGLVESRAKAQSLVMARRVTVNGSVADKAGQPVPHDAVVEITSLEHPWVGRGGMKLSHALQTFGIDPRGKICADIGASTGGFTHVLLAGGAAKVYAIDVGYGQLDASLRDDPRVVNREKVNARYLTPGDFDETLNLVSIDVSFISLRLIVPVLPPLMTPGAPLVALVKPQFEVGKRDVGKGGIVRDDAKRAAAVEGVVESVRELGFTIGGVIESPVRGAAGNVEYLLHATAPPITVND
jgi:23S rRNA (cytidine1920-2'-O)/16S rRNA (cytidine1409-2'-O)-methyltransferase